MKPVMPITEDPTWKVRVWKNGSVSQALHMSAYCRESCQNLYKNYSLEDLPEHNRWISGFGNYVYEPFGQRLNICAVSEGWIPFSRNRALGVLVANHIQSAVVPAFHPIGFEKTTIPRHMYAQILSARKRLLRDEKYKIESCDHGMHNCGRVVVSNVSQECHLVSNENYLFLQLDYKTSNSVFEQLKELAEEWIGKKN